jgi:hypothetical protein
MRRLLLALIAAHATPALLAGQTAAAVESAARTITQADVQLRINVIADDSMMGRDTPSPGLEQTAQYVAAQFRRFGLQPAGENGTWFQRYTISRRRLNVAGSHIGFMIRGQHTRVSLASNARYVFGGVPAGEVHAPTLLVGGAYTVEDVERADAKGKAVILVMDYSQPLTPALQQAVGALRGGGATGVILLSNRDSATFAQRMASPGQVRIGVDGTGETSPVVELHQRAVGSVLAAAGIHPDQIRASDRAMIRDVPDLVIGFGLRDSVLHSVTAPNTVGMLEGSDPKLKDEFVLFSAHMDHLGTAGGGECRARGGDTICNGADDDGSGTVGVIELAEAFSRKGARPRRSMMFLTVSGEEKGLFGSSYFTEHPTVPLSQVVADLNIDMIGRNWKDTIVAIGREHSSLGPTLARVNAAHPELNMTAIDDRWPEENFYYRSDHYNFARRGVPILFFFSGTHADYHQVTDSPDKLDSEKEARILRLLFYLGQDVANAADRPKWVPQSYARIVTARRD